MSRIILAVPVLALAVLLSGSAQAADGVPSDTTLKAMGLADIQVMSDVEAMSIRGKGYEPRKKKGHGSSSEAWGMSWASVGSSGGNGGHGGGHGGGKNKGRSGGSNGGGNGGGNAGAGTKDGFKARGQYLASGDHFSEAGITTTTTDIKTVNGVKIKTSNVRSVYVFAGGSASATSL